MSHANIWGGIVQVLREKCNLEFLRLNKFSMARMGKWRGESGRKLGQGVSQGPDHLGPSVIYRGKRVSTGGGMI